LKKKPIESAIETLPGVFHSLNWGGPIEQDLLKSLIEIARENLNNKARFCLHPNPSDLLQITYLAFVNPYLDRIHKHPDKIEVIVPIRGQAIHNTYDSSGKVIRNLKLDSSNPVALSTTPGSWHGIEILSENFVMLEIGAGPFLPTSTIFM
jgi:cupin fold WbuC family metalloprotein